MSDAHAQPVRVHWIAESDEAAGDLEVVGVALDRGQPVVAFYGDGPIDFAGTGSRSRTDAEWSGGLAAFATNGAPEWSGRYGDSGRLVLSGVSAANGTVTVSGRLGPSRLRPEVGVWVSESGQTTTGPLALGVVARVAGGGRVEWVHAFEASGGSSADAVAALPGGGVVVVGAYGGRPTFATLPLRHAGPPAEATLRAGDVVGSTHAFVGSISPDGSVGWTVPIVSPTSEVGLSTVSADDAGGLCVAGSVTASGQTGNVRIGAITAPTAAGVNGFVARLDADGAPRWLQTIRPSEEGAQALLLSVAAVEGGGCVLGGQAIGALRIGDESVSGMPSGPGRIGGSLVFALGARGDVVWWDADGDGRAGVVRVESVATSGGEVYVGGRYIRAGAFGKASLPQTASPLWKGFVGRRRDGGTWALTAMGGNGDSRIDGIQLGASGEVYLSGTVWGGGDLAGHEIGGSQSRVGFAARVSFAESGQ